MATIRVRFGCLLCLSSLSPFFSFFSRSFLFFLPSWGSLRTKRGLKPLWNTRCSPFTTLSLSSPSSSLCLSLSLAFCWSPSSIFLSLSLYLSLSLFPSSSLCLSLSLFLYLFSFFFHLPKLGVPKKQAQKRSETTLKHLPAHHLRTAAAWRWLLYLYLSIYLSIYLSAPFSLDGLFTTLVIYVYQLEILIFKI